MAEYGELSGAKLEGEEEEIILYYKEQGAARDQAVLVELLREIQSLYGCIPSDVRQQIAEALDIKEAVVTKIIKLYPSLRLAPRRHQIVLCAGASCSSRGSWEVAEAVRKLLYGRKGEGGKDVAVKEDAIKEGAVEEAAIKEGAVEEAAIEETAIEEVAVKEAAEKEPAVDRNIGRAVERLDGYFTLSCRGCMKHCAEGVNLTVDDDMYHHVTPEQIPDILGKYMG